MKESILLIDVIESCSILNPKNAAFNLSQVGTPISNATMFMPRPLCYISNLINTKINKSAII